MKKNYLHILMNYLLPAIISGIGWGIIPLFDRILLKYLDGLRVAGLRTTIMGICAVLILFYFILKNDRELFNGFKNGVTKNNKFLPFLFISPFIGFVFGHLAYYTSLNLAPKSTTQVVLISHVLPLIIIAILAPCVYGDKINWQMILGIMLSLLGIYITVAYNPN